MRREHEAAFQAQGSALISAWRCVATPYASRFSSAKQKCVRVERPFLPAPVTPEMASTTTTPLAARARHGRRRLLQANGRGIAARAGETSTPLACHGRLRRARSSGNSSGRPKAARCNRSVAVCGVAYQRS